MFRWISKKIFICLSVVLTLFSCFHFPPQVSAQNFLTCSATTNPPSPIRYSFDPNANTPEQFVSENSPITATFNFSTTSSTNLRVELVQEEVQAGFGYSFDPQIVTTTANSITATWKAGQTDNGIYKMNLRGVRNGTDQILCTVPRVFEVVNSGAVPLDPYCNSFTVEPATINDTTQGLRVSVDLNDFPPKHNSPQDLITFTFIGARREELGTQINVGAPSSSPRVTNQSFDGFDITWLQDLGAIRTGKIVIERQYDLADYRVVCEKTITYDNQTNTGVIGSGNTNSSHENSAFILCQQAGSNQNTCQKCAETGGIWTGVGCIPYTDTPLLVRAFITLGLGIAGTVVVLMTLAGAFLMSTSRGEPQRVDEAKSLITSAIAGIFFLIFSVSILQFIGVSILRIPGFG